MAENVVNLDFSNRWSCFKHLNKVVNSAVITKSAKDVSELESLLRRHKPDFLSLLKHLPQSAIHRDVVLQSVKDGISIVQHQHRSRKLIPKTVVEEALLMSEMFKLNELMSLELLITGEHQMPRYPGASRGPVAVMLYYDAKRSLLSSLKFLLQGVSGRTWVMSDDRDFNRLVTNFLKELLDNGVVDRAFDALESFDVRIEFDLLQKNRALGPGKFKHQIYDLIKEIRDLFSYIIFGFSAQFTLDSNTTKRLLRFISSKSSLESNGCLDSVSTTLMMAFLYTIDVSALQTHDESDPVVQNLPLLKNHTLLKELLNQISGEFPLVELKTIFTFILGLSTKSINVHLSNCDSYSRGLKEDSMIDEAIEKRVFECLSSLLVRNQHIRSEEFYMMRIHGILTDIPYLMPVKLKELRDKGDELGRILAAYAAEGITAPSSLSRNFERFLNLLTDFYSDDPHGFSAEFWKREETRISGFGFTEKYSTFAKFIQSTLETFLPQTLHLSLLKLLGAFASASPFSIYTLLKATGTSQNPQFSLDHFFKIFNQYYGSFRGVKPQELLGYTSGRQEQTGGQQNAILTLTDVEMLCGILELIQRMVQKDKNVCLAVAENQTYDCISTFIGLVSCPVARKLKSCLLTCLGGFANCTPSVALNIWLRLDLILPKPQVAVGTSFGHANQHQKNWQNGVCIEIEDIEPRNEEYLVTSGFLNCLKSVVPHVICIKEATKQSTLETAINFLVNAIFLKIDSRVFRRQEEKWSIFSCCLDILHEVFAVYQPDTDETSIRSSFALMTQILQEASLFRCIMAVIETVSSTLDSDNPNPHVITSDPAVAKLQERSLLMALMSINCVIHKQKPFSEMIRSIPGFPSAALMPIQSLFCNISPKSSEADRLATLIRMTSISIPSIQKETVILLRGLVADEPSISHLCLLQIQPFKKHHEDYILHGLVDCIESHVADLRKETLQMILDFLKSDVKSGAPYGLAHKILGYDRKMQLRIPGSMDQTFTCLHSVVATLESFPSVDNLQERSLCMQILYLLSSDRNTGPNTLRFLRTSYDLLTNYLQMRTALMERNNDNQLVTKTSLAEVSWFWRLLATDIKATNDSSLRSHSTKYMKLMLGDEGLSRKLTDLNPHEVLQHKHPEMPEWDYFDRNELWKTIGSSCGSDGTSSEIDVKLLHFKLLNEVRQFGSQLGASQATLIHNEIKRILSFACDLNSSREILAQKVNYFDGWRDLTETTLSTEALEFLSSQTRAMIVLELMHSLITSASCPDTISRLMGSISSVILITSTKLKGCHVETVSRTQLLQLAKSLEGILEISSSCESWSSFKRARVNFYGALLHIYNCLKHFGGAEPRVSSRLIDRLIRDSMSGTDLVKVLALSVLNETDPSNWSQELASNGSLRSLITSLATDDKEMKASKCDSNSKCFYSFDSKMSLFIKIASSLNGSRTLIHVGIIEVISRLEVLEMYPFILNQSQVCFRVFSSVLRLMVTLSDWSIASDHETLAQFLSCQTPVLYDVMKSPQVYRDSDEGRTCLTLITSLLSKLILFTDQQLQKSYISYVNMYSGLRNDPDAIILCNIIQGCIRFTTDSPLTPLFVPSWDFEANFSGPPTLGSLVVIMEGALLRKSSTGSPDTELWQTYQTIIESCLYMMYHHLRLFFDAIDLSPEELVAISQLKERSGQVLTDNFLKGTQGSVFSDSLIRRIQRIILN